MKFDEEMKRTISLDVLIGFNDKVDCLIGLFQFRIDFEMN